MKSNDVDVQFLVCFGTFCLCVSTTCTTAMYVHVLTVALRPLGNVTVIRRRELKRCMPSPILVLINMGG